MNQLCPALLAVDQSNEIGKECTDESAPVDISFLYSCLSMHIFNTLITIPSQIQTIPYPHQHACISWMCSREGMSVDPIEEQRYEILSRSLHSLFLEWPDHPGVYYSPVTHQVFDERVSAMVPRQGGVLCDTMGFGKTFEIIMLILAHPYPGEEGEKDEKERTGGKEDSNDDGSKEMGKKEKEEEMAGKNEGKMGCEEQDEKGEGIKKENEVVETVQKKKGQKEGEEEYQEVDNRVYSWKKCFALNEQRTLGELEYSHYEQSFNMPSTIQKINPKKCR